ncbi:MAG TPA: potassium-transporting ATPase subunit KdpA [Thermoanaerobaculia bacterium]|jgi:K+-transporting ATPase ATPase A chain|nr:potassium-transporting ATPase subunit KdpA [Thermoanaerobaculia bacterium]
MTTNGLLQIVLYFVVLLALVKPLGAWMARVYEGKPLLGLDRVLGPVERLIYRLCGVRPEEEMDWQGYAFALLLFSVVSLVVLYVQQRVQPWLPLNPAKLGAVTPDSSFNTAASFTTNTNWQGYGGESTMSYLTQMAGLAVHNFGSAAAGMAVLVAFIRGLARKNAKTIGNFWVDLVRTTLYILLPLSLVLALLLVSQGVVQTFSAYQVVQLAERPAGQVLAVGPVASQIAIKQLGTNGGGYYNVNSAHPFENPTPLSNFFEVLSILLIPAALCYTFGRMVGDTRQGWAVLAAMTITLLPLLLLCYSQEQHGNPAFDRLGVDQGASALQPGGNMEGKEARYGIANSALWAATTTAASNGSVNSMHDSYTPLGGLVPLFLMQFSETIFGGVGSGLYGMLIFVIVAVFIAGLMVGRTPEYLGKKIESYEIKMASLVVLIMPLIVLLATAIAVVVPAGLQGIANPGAHGFSEILYAYTSMGNNNGSAFGGISANTPFYNVTGGLAMLFSRFWLAIPTLAIAGSLAKKKQVPASPGTLPTHTPLFVVLLIGVIVLVGALTFFPALALGPIVEHLQMMTGGN